MGTTPPQVATAALRASMKYPYVSRQHSAEKLGTRLATSEGHAVVSSRQEEKNIMARTGMVRE